MELDSGHVFVCPHPPLKMRTPFGLDCFVLLSRAYHRKTKKERRWQATKSSILSPENNFEHVYLPLKRKWGFTSILEPHWKLGC
uniref:Uncharacterized protein n=1 Tax=Populus trichocarpa TaxID=3694 RepID=A0A3N7GLJ8_POPTR